MKRYHVLYNFKRIGSTYGNSVSEAEMKAKALYGHWVARAEDLSVREVEARSAYGKLRDDR